MSVLLPLIGEHLLIVLIATAIAVILGLVLGVAALKYS